MPATQNTPPLIRAASIAGGRAKSNALAVILLIPFRRLVLRLLVLATVGVAMALPAQEVKILAAWGYNYYGQTNIPAGLTNVVAIAGGGNHSLALRADGTVAAWGRNSEGQTGIPPGLTNVVVIASGDYHSLALRADGSVVAWGNNDYGQTNIPAGLTNVVVIASGDFHSLALRADGTVVAWGYNSSGQTNVPAGLTNVVAIAGGGNHSLAVVRFATSSGGLPAIVLQPQSQTVAVGAGVSFSVSASGTSPLGYQWQCGGTNLAAGGRWSGVNSTVLTLSNVQPVDAGSYRIIVTNSSGTATSAVAVLTVRVPLPITLDPQPIQNGHFGFNVVNQPGQQLEIQASTNLVHWNTILVFSSSGTFRFEDSATGNYGRRFYRLRLP